MLTGAVKPMWSMAWLSCTTPCAKGIGSVALKAATCVTGESTKSYSSVATRVACWIRMIWW